MRSIFESFYPHQTCIETVPGGFSVACSTAKAVEWDEEWKAAAAAVLSIVTLHSKCTRTLPSVLVSKETCCFVKRDLLQCQKRPITDFSDFSSGIHGRSVGANSQKSKLHSGFI